MARRMGQLSQNYTVRVPAAWRGRIDAQTVKRMLNEANAAKHQLPPDPGPGEGETVTMFLPRIPVNILAAACDDKPSAALRRLVAFYCDGHYAAAQMSGRTPATGGLVAAPRPAPSAPRTAAGTHAAAHMVRHPAPAAMPEPVPTYYYWTALAILLGVGYKLFFARVSTPVTAAAVAAIPAAAFRPWVPA